MRKYNKRQDLWNRMKLGVIVLLVLYVVHSLTSSYIDRDASYSIKADTVFLPSGIVEINKTIIVDKKTIYIGKGTTLVNRTDSVVFYVTANDTEFHGITFQNMDNNKLRSGIYFIEAGFWKVTDCSFYGMDAYGIRYSKTNKKEALGGTISNCDFSKNKVAVFADYLGDFVTITASNFTNNETAILCRGGNNIVNACNVNYNRFGIEIAAGANNGHGIISNSNINHNLVYALKLNDYQTGQTISNCHIYDGEIHIENAYSTKFNSCFIDARNYTFINSPNTEFIHCTFTKAYHIKTEGDYKLMNCTSVDGGIVSKI